LEGLRKICDQESIVLIFDEVMTGFRLAKGGAQELLGVHADLTTLGKIIGGGMPVGAYGGKKEIMDCVSPLGKVYQAGTLSGNPVAMAAGIAMLNHLNTNPQIYQILAKNTDTLMQGIKQICQALDLPVYLTQLGSMCCIFFTEQPVTDFSSALKSDTSKFSVYFNEMLHQGIYLAPSQFESLFLSLSIEEAQIGAILGAAKVALTKVSQI